VEDRALDGLVEELLAIPMATAAHRSEISRLAARRRVLARQLGDLVGPTMAAKRLGISRQTFWQILNPQQAYEIKRRSSRSSRTSESADPPL
jgi:hypothetical protein